MAKKSFKQGLNSLLQKTDSKPEAEKSEQKEKVSAAPVKKSAVKKPVAKKATTTKKKVSPPKTTVISPETAKKPVVAKSEIKPVEKKVPEEIKADQKKESANKSSLEVLLKPLSTIDSVEDLSTQLLSALDSKANKIVIMGAVESIDLASIQVLKRFEMDAITAKKEVQFEIKLTDDLKDLLSKAGMYDKAMFV